MHEAAESNVVYMDPTLDPKFVRCQATVTSSFAHGESMQCRQQAKWHPVFVLRVKGCTQSVRAAIPIDLCNDCHKAVKLTDILTENGWMTIIQAFCAQKKKPPKRNLTTLAWVEIGSEEDLLLLRMFA